MLDINTIYSRADILNLKNCKNSGYDIINREILDTISKPTAIKGLTSNTAQHTENNNGSQPKKTKRGCRAGKHQIRRTIQQAAPLANCESIKKKPAQPQTHPTVLYTNCRSLNNWKLDELTLYAHTYKPDIICLTETWINETKEQSTQIDGFNS